MERTSFGVSSSLSVFVATLLASEVLMRASWLLPENFDRGAFLVRFGSGPLVGLGLLVCGLTTFFVCRAMVGRLGMRSQTEVMVWAARFVARGVGAGLIAGAVIAWILIRVDGMGNGGDTDIVRYEIRDFVQSSVIGVGAFLVAALTVRLPKAPSAANKVEAKAMVSHVSNSSDTLSDLLPGLGQREASGRA